MMELIPMIDDVGDALPGGSAVGAGIQDPIHQPPAVEVLEDRVLLASDASVPIAAPAAEPMPAEPAAYVAAQNPGHSFVDLAGVAEAVEAPAEPEQTTHQDRSAGQTPTHGNEPHAEIVEHQSEPAEARQSERGEIIEHGLHRNEFGLATIEPEPAMSPRDRELAKELLGDNQNNSPSDAS